MSSQTPGPSAKRRRVEAANKTLLKPFRSPLINRPKPGADDAGDGPANPDGEQPGISTPSKPTTGRGLRTTSSTGPQVGTGKGKAPGRLSLHSAGSPLAHKTNQASSDLFKAPEIKLPVGSAPPTLKLEDLPKRYELGSLSDRLSKCDGFFAMADVLEEATSACLKDLEDEIKVRKEANRKAHEEDQAKRPRGQTDKELMEAIAKWRRAGRIAAEELFEMVKGRYADTGGMKGWKEDRKRKREESRSMWGFEGSGQNAKRGDDGEEEEGAEYGEGRGEEEDDDDEDEGYTMEIMLRSLEIEPKTLGYNPVDDTWQD
ncbi:hypothetical protein QBC47DRAFT_155467 [Echria macrotheca]|uniref:Uncharacterized protein n=1 Tax=Echria macrotheca TaxID=438768 RepID=A0AAJ0FDA1_9PEZI|nr:hypothetical protein QBC47DRAFT_155467 [Echria macrotheca]